MTKDINTKTIFINAFVEKETAKEGMPLDCKIALMNKNKPGCLKYKYLR
jgi:hypothetical protein